MSCLVITACGGDKKKGGSTPAPTPAPEEGPSKLLGDDMVALIGKYCVECHGSTNPDANLDLTKVDVILANAEAIVASIEDGSMPSDDQELTAEELAIVAAWKQDNYPAPSAGTTTETDPETGPEKNDGDEDKDGDNPNQNNDYKSCDKGDEKDFEDGEGKGKGKGFFSGWFDFFDKDRCDDEDGPDKEEDFKEDS